MGKSTKKTHSKNASHDGITEPLQVVNTDLMWSISPTALGNISHIAKFLDVYSRISALYFLKNKTTNFSSVFDSFINIERDLAIRFGRRVQYLRFDLGN